MNQDSEPHFDHISELGIFVNEMVSWCKTLEFVHHNHM
jgi:hypothetical protein